MAANYQMLFELNAALGGGFTSAFTQGAQQMDNMKAKLDALNSAGSTGDVLGGISAALETAGVVKGLEMVYDSLKECAEAAAAFETAMAGVKRTVGGDDAFIEGLGESFKKLSTEIPITADELAGIATTAGQLGIAQKDVETFTTVMAQLGTTTDLTADNAATMLAQFSNITGVTDYDRLGSTVAALGDSTATTASKVVEMSQGMAAAASQAGMSERDILAISAAVGSLGIEAAAGSTSMSQLITKLYKATETGDKLEEFASVAGMSAEQFKQSWGEDAVGTMNAFIQGLNDTERNGRSAVVILDELGITNVRQTKAILGLASAGDLLSNTINLANSAWEKNTALGEKAGVMYNTTEAKLTMMQNAANNVKIAIGDALTPMIGSFAEGLTNMLQPVSEFIEANPALVQGITAFVGVLGVAVAAIGAYTAITKLASAANLIFAGSIPGIGIIMGVAAAVGALVFGISALTDAYNDAHPSFEQLDAEFDALNEKAKEQQAIIDLAEEYKELTADIASTEAAMKFTAELDIGDVSEENLKLIDKLKEKMVDKTAELKQTLELAGAEDITDDDMQTLIDLAANAQTSDDTLKQTLELMGVDEVTPEMIQQVRDFAGAIATDSGTLEQELRLIGFDDATVAGMGYSSYKDFVADVAAGKVVVNADGTITQKLDLGQVAPDDMTLIKEIAENNGYVVTADGKVTQTVDIGGIKEKDLQQLERLKKDVTNAEAKLTQKLELVGVENITDEKLNQFLKLKVNTADGQHELKQLLALEGAENATPYQINQIKEFIKAVQTKQGKVDQKLSATVSIDQITALGYSTMEEFVAAVNAGEVVINADGTVTQTVDVSGDVAELKEAWENENALAEAEAAEAAAAEELAGKKAHLKDVTKSLADSSDGFITATDQETEALNRQIEAYENIKKAELEVTKSKIKENVYSQSDAYVKSMQNVRAEQQRVAEAQKAFDSALHWNTEGPEALKGRIAELSTEMQNIANMNIGGNLMDNKAFKEAAGELEGIIELVTGIDKNYAPGAWTMMIRDANNLAISEEGLNSVLLGASNTLQFYQGNLSEAGAMQNAFIQNMVEGLQNGTIESGELEATLTAAFANYENGGEIVAEVMSQVESAVNAAKAAAEGSGATAQSEAQTTVAAVGDIITQMENLKKAYDEAKASAMAALGGRFGTFDEVGEGAESKSTAEMEKNMNAQEAYWTQYNNNLQTALDKGLAPEIAKQLVDGSAESAASLKTLANASEEEIQKINENFAEVEAAKETLASTIADMQTNFTEGMAALKEELENTVKELDKGSEAAAAAEATMSAYVESLGAAEGEASAQAQAIADAVNAALSTIADVDVNINYHENGKPDDLGATVEGENAIGTDYAARGLHLVGEEGPELVMMHGGEKVLTAHETVNALSGAGSGEGGRHIEVQFSPVFNVNGGDTAQIRAVMMEEEQRLRAQIISVMEDVITDRMRMSYV